MRSFRLFADRLLPVAAAGLALSACQRPADPPKPEPPAAKAVAPPTLSLPPPAVDRAELLRALDTASSAYAAGRPDESPALAGRRFVIRQSFGCDGPTSREALPQPGLAAWTVDAKNQTIELTLRPTDWTSWAPSADAESSWEAIEGFWLNRPWLRAEGCPAPRDTSAASPSPPSPLASRQTAGLAAVFEKGGSRSARRDGKPFTHTMRAEDGPPTAPTGGYRVVLEGRFVAFPAGRAIRCRAENPDERPVCIAAARIDRIAFEDAEGQLLTEWRPG